VRVWPGRRGEIWSRRRGERFTEDEAVTLWLRRSRDEMPYLTGRPCGVGR
jgi:hypothetical protein